MKEQRLTSILMKQINSICIIDDDPITVFGIKKILDTVVECEQIYTYRNGKLAIDGIQEMVVSQLQVPDIIFLDINMPIMDGWEFLEEFIALPIKKIVKINIITSSIDPFDMQRSEVFKGRTKHTISFRNKPISKKEIQEITIAA